MTDWSTVVIAAIAGAAGISGGVITGNYSMKALAKSHKRDDAGHLRDAVEELFSELDAIQRTSSAQIPLAMVMTTGNQPERPIEAVNFGKMRALVGLYFPEFDAILATFSERETAAVVASRTSIQNGVNPMIAGGTYALEQSVYVSALCQDLRNALSARAAVIGASVRASIE